MNFFFWGLKHEFETARVNEPSVFEPLKFYCILYKLLWSQAICVACEKAVSGEEGRIDFVADSVGATWSPL